MQIDERIEASCSIAQLHAALISHHVVPLQTTAAGPLEFSLVLNRIGSHHSGRVYFFVGDEHTEIFPSFEKFREAFPMAQHADALWNGSYRPVVLPAGYPFKLDVPDMFAPQTANVPSLIAPSGTFGRLPSFLTTWLLLYGLSMCARYSSDTWGKAIQLDGSPDYLPLHDFFLESQSLIELVLAELERGRK